MSWIGFRGGIIMEYISKKKIYGLKKTNFQSDVNCMSTEFRRVSDDTFCSFSLIAILNVSSAI